MASQDRISKSTWLSVEYARLDIDGKAWADWIAYILRSRINWPAEALELDSPREVNKGRGLHKGEITIAARTVFLGGGKPLTFDARRGDGLVIWVDPDREPIDGVMLDLSQNIEFTATTLLLAAVKEQFGDGPGSDGYSPRRGRVDPTPSDKAATIPVFPGRSKVARRHPSTAREQPVSPAGEPAATMAAATPSFAVFISYSHKDDQWRARLQTHLKPLQREGYIQLWDDTRIRAGDEWRQEIERAIALCKIAILLVSPDFLASDFIHHNELPPLLERAERRGVRILSIIVSPSSYEHSQLARYQAVNPPSKPLRALKRWEQDEIFAEVYDEVRHALRGGPQPPDSSGRDEGSYRRTIAAGEPHEAPEAARQLGQLLVEQGRSLEAELAYRRAMDFASSPTVRSAARQLVDLLAKRDQFREAAEIYTAAGLEPPSGIGEVDYYIGHMPQDDSSKEAAKYFIDNIRRTQRWFDSPRDVVPARNAYELLDDRFGHRYNRGPHDQEKARLRAEILGRDPDARPRAAYDFGELLAQEQEQEQEEEDSKPARGAFEWALEQNHPRIAPRAAYVLASRYVSGNRARRLYQKAISFGDLRLKRIAARRFALLLDRCGDTQSAQFLRREYDQRGSRQ